VARDEVGRVGRDLHQTAGARARGLVAEARFLVDHRGDQRRVEALVGGLLANDVVVPERERDLAHGIRAETGHDGHARGRHEPRHRNHAEPAAPDPGARGASGDSAGGV
jgi:hypothetical protein